MAYGKLHIDKDNIVDTDVDNIRDKNDAEKVARYYGAEEMKKKVTLRKQKLKNCYTVRETTLSNRDKHKRCK